MVILTFAKNRARLKVDKHPLWERNIMSIFDAEPKVKQKETVKKKIKNYLY